MGHSRELPIGIIVQCESGDRSHGLCHRREQETRVATAENGLSRFQDIAHRGGAAHTCRRQTPGVSHESKPPFPAFYTGKEVKCPAKNGAAATKMPPVQLAASGRDKPGMHPLRTPRTIKPMFHPGLDSRNIPLCARLKALLHAVYGRGRQGSLSMRESEHTTLWSCPSSVGSEKHDLSFP